MGEIDDPPKLISALNSHISGIKTLLETVEDEKTKAKLYGHLVAFYDLLEKALHQAFQQGKGKRDVAVELGKRKARVNA